MPILFPAETGLVCQRYCAKNVRARFLPYSNTYGVHKNQVKGQHSSPRIPPAKETFSEDMRAPMPNFHGFGD